MAKIAYIWVWQLYLCHQMRLLFEVTLKQALVQQGLSPHFPSPSHLVLPVSRISSHRPKLSVLLEYSCWLRNMLKLGPLKVFVYFVLILLLLKMQEKSEQHNISEKEHPLINVLSWKSPSLYFQLLSDYSFWSKKFCGLIQTIFPALDFTTENLLSLSVCNLIQVSV